MGVFKFWALATSITAFTAAIDSRSGPAAVLRLGSQSLARVVYTIEVGNEVMDEL